MTKDRLGAQRKRVGKSIRKWRHEEGYVLTEIAKRIKVSQGSLSDLENGLNFPSFTTVCRLKKKYPKADWNTILFS